MDKLEAHFYGSIEGVAFYGKPCKMILSTLDKNAIKIDIEYSHYFFFTKVATVQVADLIGNGFNAERFLKKAKTTRDNYFDNLASQFKNPSVSVYKSGKSSNRIEMEETDVLDTEGPTVIVDVIDIINDAVVSSNDSSNQHTHQTSHHDNSSNHHVSHIDNSSHSHSSHSHDSSNSSYDSGSSSYDSGSSDSGSSGGDSGGDSGGSCGGGGD